ncbi:MAG: hypothetical protein R3B84_04395 [Zavarzinella sp.]
MKNVILAMVVLSPLVASAQDMPLHTIIHPSAKWETWGATFPADDQKASFQVSSVGKLMLNEKEVSPTVENVAAISTWHRGGTLAVAFKNSKYVWAYRITKTGVDAGDTYVTLRVRPMEIDAMVTAMCIDATDRLYVACKSGIQIFDPTGRLCGVVTLPDNLPVSGIRITQSKDGVYLYAQGTSTVFRLPLLGK